MVPGVLLALLCGAADLPADLPIREGEAARWFAEAGREEINPGARNDARRKAWTAARSVVADLEARAAAVPGERDALAPRMAKAAAVAYWIARESPAGVLPKEAEIPAPVPPAEPVPLPADAAGAAAALRGNDPAILALWREILLRHRERASEPAYLEAARAHGAALGSLRDVYRAARDADPVDLKGADGPGIRALVLDLARGLGAAAPADRLRAAEVLGHVGSAEAIHPLARQVAIEKDPAVVAGIHGAFAAIGGQRVVDRLLEFRTDPGAHRALETLRALSARNPVDRRAAVLALGQYGLSGDEALADGAVRALHSLGPDGAPGLVAVLGHTSLRMRILAIQALGRSKEPRAARPLSKFLISGDNPNTQSARNQAEAAIRALGKMAVPWVFAALKDPDTKLAAGALLRDLTGQGFTSGQFSEWVHWWRTRHPDWKGEFE
jgi:HEAT repeat protein